MTSHTSDIFATMAQTLSASTAHMAAAFEQPIADLMQRNVITIRLDDTLADAQRLLIAHGLSWAPVVDGGSAALGVISESDLLLFQAAGHDAASTRAWQVCTYRPVTVSPDTPVGVVAKLMVERRIHHVVVVNEGEIVGVASSMDFLRVMSGAA